MCLFKQINHKINHTQQHQECGEGEYSSEWNAVSCTQCPRNTVSAPNSTSVVECACKAGYYEEGGRLGRPCKPCPRGARCSGGLSAPVPKKGYTASTDGVIVACRPAAACEGGGSCATGYSGDRCASCTVGYHRSNGYCVDCGNKAAILFCLGLILLFGGCAAAVAANMRQSSLTGAVSAIISLNAVQILVLVGRLDLEWPAAARVILDALSVVSFNIELLVSPECLVYASQPFYARYTLFVLLPLAPAGVLTAFYAVHTALLHRVGWDWLPEPRGFRRAVIQTGFQAALVLYLPLSAATLEYFKCAPSGVPGVRVVATSPEVVCGSKRWNAGLGLAIPFSGLYTVGLPAALAYLLRRHALASDSQLWLLDFGFILSRYKANLFYYELVIVARKLGVVLCVMFVSSSPYLQAGAALFWLFASFVVNASTRPYNEDRHNHVEASVTMAIEFILLATIMFQGEDYVGSASRSVIM